MRAALARLARRLRGAQAQLRDCRRLSSGASMQTWVFEVESQAGRETLVLRRQVQAPAATGGLSLELAAEARLLQAMAQRDVPVAPFIHLCDDMDALGAAHVTRYVAGETLGRKIVSDARFAAVRPRLARQCGEILARIHTTAAPPAAGLTCATAAHVLARYEQLYRDSGACRPVLELALRQLRALAPALTQGVLLHGDFRNGNLIVDPERGVVAVLDWELAHLGDPAEDLGWLCVNSWRFGRCEHPVGGFGSYDALLEGYAAGGGAAPSRACLRFWQAVGSFKWAVMCLGMYRAWALGHTRSPEQPMIGRRVSEAEIDLLNLLEAGL